MHGVPFRLLRSNRRGYGAKLAAFGCADGKPRPHRSTRLSSPQNTLVKPCARISGFPFVSERRPAWFQDVETSRCDRVTHSQAGGYWEDRRFNWFKFYWHGRDTGISRWRCSNAQMEPTAHVAPSRLWPRPPSREKRRLG